MSQIAENFSHIKTGMLKAALQAGRLPQDVTLVAVSKKQPTDKIYDALNTGHRVFGENRVQDAMTVWSPIKKTYPDIQLHLIGSLQTNKVKEAVSFFDVIETLDREKLVDALADEMRRQNKNIPCFIQVNTGEEPQKSGVSPAGLPGLIAYARQEGLTIQGLMCIPPEQEPSGLYFAFLSKLAAQHGLASLSMGMSGDFEKAIALGATHIRVGTALFGVRTS
ncbi:MAG: YggS family pyridoxal phosphate-dependent enzyme [Alphaproteobacteria bacterium]|nr:YggS family pyridoxal phosphate-dependent enzyme [Alphaproteobacteria bacterium]